MQVENKPETRNTPLISQNCSEALYLLKNRVAGVRNHIPTDVSTKSLNSRTLYKIDDGGKLGSFFEV